MLVGVFSDTHDRLDTLAEVVDVFQKNQVELMVHCGDWVAPFTMEYFDKIREDWDVPLKSVLGNNEGNIAEILERNNRLRFPIEFAPKLVLELDVDEKRLAVFHGHDKAVLRGLIGSDEYDAVFHGHTHVARNEMVGNTLVLNPGSTSYARGSLIVSDASVAVYDTKDNTATIISLKES